jgi:hypothetical protein
MNGKRWEVGEEHEAKRFRFGFVISPGQFDFSPLKLYCDRIIYATDGFSDTVESIREQLEESLARFDPNKDVIVTTGKTVASVMTGMIIMRRIQEAQKRDWDSVAFGIFQAGDYLFWRIPTDPAREVYDITHL